jgi:hypothetical protein
MWIDGNALIAAKRRSRKALEEKVNYYRKAGASDAEIVKAMADSREIIDRVGPLRSVKHRKPQ